MRNAFSRKTESNSDGSGTIPAATANDLQKGRADVAEAFTIWEVVDEPFTVWEVDEALLDSKIKKFTWQLKESAGGAYCSIFKIPKSLAEVRPKDYQPHIASFGPYHRGQDGLQIIYQHKWRFLNDLVGRSKKENGMGLADYRQAMETLEADARECYSEIISLDSKKFVEMMVALALKMFNVVISKSNKVIDEVISRCENLHPKPKHLLDLFRSSFIPPHLKERRITNQPK